MSATIRETTHTRNIGWCPACGGRLRAEVTVVSELRDPFWPDVPPGKDKPEVSASARVVAADVWEHHCDKREGGDE